MEKALSVRYQGQSANLLFSPQHGIFTRAVLIPVTDLNPDSDFHDFFASIPIPIQFRVRSDSNLEPTPQVDLIPYTYIRTHCR